MTATRSPTRTRGGVGDGAEAGDHAAAEQRRLPQGYVGRDGNGGGGGHDRILGKAGDGQAVLQDGAVAGAQPRGAVGQIAGDRLAPDRLAQGAPSRPARRAHPARRNHGEHHVVARCDSGDSVADGLHDAGALVAQHHRPAAGAEAAVSEVDVGVADPGRGDPDEHLAGPWRRQLHRLDRRHPPGLTQDAGPHRQRRPGLESAQGRRGHLGASLCHTADALSSSARRIDPLLTPNWARTASIKISADELGSRRRA